MPFDPLSYLQRRSALVNNWQSDPGYETVYGSIENYALADASQHGTPEEKQQIMSGDITVPEGFEINNPTEEIPLEQDILEQALPGLLDNIDDDEDRQRLADRVMTDSVADYEGTRQLLGQSLGGGRFDAQRYLEDNPDVAEVIPYIIQQGNATTPEQAAEWHYQTYGRTEGRPAYLTTSQRLQQENAQADATSAALQGSARTSANSQLAALQESVAAMQGNLQGELAQRAAALQQQIAALNQNLDTLDATQRQALAEQISAQQKNLEDAIAAKRGALGTQVGELQQNLQNAVNAQTTAVDERAKQLADIAVQENTAKLNALKTEIDGLTAAQAPLNQARLDSADALTTAINLGLEQTRDQLDADAASLGYLGGSTMQDVAALRATIGARQEAARARTGAREANAVDTRTINSRAATESRVLGNELAGNQATIGVGRTNNLYDLATALAQGTQKISDFGTNSRAGLTNEEADERRGINDTGAVANAALTNSTAQQRKGIADAGTNTTYTDTNYGASERRRLGDSLATGTAGVKSNLATQIQDATNKGITAKQVYFDQDYGRALQAASALGELGNGLLTTSRNTASARNSGLANTLGILDWWSSNSQAPTTSTNTPAADQSGSALGTLGAGLTGAALNFANSQNWWQTPKKTTTVRTSTPAPTNYNSDYGVV